jgi:hypothetical protein
METLLKVAVVLIAVGVVAQTCVLIAMYLMSRRISGKAEALMNETRVPLESITSNLKTVSNELAETGKIARAQAEHIQETATDAGKMLLRPLREYTAIAVGVAAGIRAFFSERKPRETQTETEQKRKHRKHPAA